MAFNPADRRSPAPIFRVFSFIGFAWMTLFGCGQSKSTDTTPSYSAAVGDCASTVIKGQYVVHYRDGHREVVHASSESEFLTGFMVRHKENIRFAEPDYRVRAAVVKNLSESEPAVASADNWGAKRIFADELWQQGVRGTGVVVAVVDSGMDLTHAQLASRVFANPGEQGLDGKGHDKAANGIDDDANGFVDDAGGYDFTAGQPLKGDYTIHGTHVAGIIAAQHTDTVAGPQTYVQGIAPDAKILPLAFLDSTGSGVMSDGVKAIEYAVQRGAKVINASWGGNICSRSLRDTIESLQNSGVIFVSASGNSGADIDTWPEYPAAFNFSSQLTVGATGAYDLMATFSNFGVEDVHIFAPGVDIVSTIPEGGMGALSGTSMATPFVSGAVALLLSAEPSASVDQIRKALYGSSVRNSTYLNASRGRMNLQSALLSLRQIMGKTP